MEIITLPAERDFGDFVKIVSLLKQGGAVVVPTDTVYGFAADARNLKTIERIFAIKGHREKQPLPVFVSSYEMLDEVAYVDDARIKNFLHKVWPGKVTCVLSSRGWMPLELRGGSLSIGVRIPNHPFIFRLLEAFSGPLTGTSANISGRGPYVKAEDVISEFEKMPVRPDLIIDAGNLPESSVSTVIDITEWPPKILREGAVSKNEIMSYI